MGRLPGGSNKPSRSSESNEERAVNGNKRSYVRQIKRLGGGGEEQPSTSNEKPKMGGVLLEKLVKEVQTLSMEVVEFERRAQDRYRSLIDENVHLRRKLDKIRSEVVQINESINKLCRERITAEKSTLSVLEKTDNSSVLDVKPQVNGAFDETDDEEKSDGINHEEGSALSTNETNSRYRKRRAAANKREGDYANMLRPTISLYERSSATADTSKFRRKKAKIARKESDDGSDADDSNDDQKEESGTATWKLYKHIQTKPQRTDLPKPKTARSGGGRNVHFTDEWKRYATAVYPIDPSHYWNLPQSEYDRLIPDSDLEFYARNPDKTEKEHLIRSIYDWFRSQHRIAQLRVVLNECNSAIDLDSLWDVYVQEMKRRNWPVYGKRLRKGEVTVAKQQLLEDFIDCNIQLY